ncbi:hypothetical protein [Frigidibacter sp. MR17.14]|uniref:hypothetical protein n=1 Tax=Frigidibacter sp. MR17.14 TaxID=3126509 RepID=UPI003012C42C
MHHKGFVWPKPQADPYALSKVQFAALFEGGERRRIVPPKTSPPKFSELVPLVEKLELFSKGSNDPYPLRHLPLP